MAELKVELPKMGESVAEATITTWLKSVGDQIEEDEPIVEIATDKVDSEVPSPCSGVLKEALDWIDTDKQYAIDKIEKAYKNEMISGINRRYAIEIIEKLKPEPKKIEKKVEQEAVDDEIMHAFRNWRM